MDIFRNQKCYDPVKIMRTGFLGIFGKQLGDVLGREQSKADQTASDAAKAAATPPATLLTPATTVGDTSKGDPTALGRAALISTSPTGVLGMDATGRRRLLGN